MPKKLSIKYMTGELLDSWGRTNNRKHYDRRCNECGKLYQPHHRTSSYCSRPCSWKNNGGQNRKAEVWWLNTKGYIEGKVWVNGKRIRVKKHRWIMEKNIGRPLMKYEDVHHLNGIKNDNRIQNLQILTHGEHTILTHTGRRKAAIAKAEAKQEVRKP